jgi:uncharacterized membrane protein YkvA (DUF1232 family)
MKKIKKASLIIADAPFMVKLVLFFAVLYLLSPIDLIPDFIPVIGQLDDLLIISLVVRYVKKHVPNFDISKL